MRTILFNTTSNLGQSVGVMIGWIGLSCITTLLFTWYMRKRELIALLADDSTSSVLARASQERIIEIQEEEKKV